MNAIVQQRRGKHRHRARQLVPILLGFGLALVSSPSLANGYPPPPGPYPFAAAENTYPASWNGRQSEATSASPQGEFAPLPLENAYPVNERDPYSANTLFGAAPEMPNTPAADTAVPVSDELPYPYPAANYPGDFGIGSPNGNTSRRADFSMDFQRDNGQTKVPPGYGYGTGGSQWHYPPVPAGDPYMAAPYPTQPPIDYPANTNASPTVETGYPAAAPYSVYDSAYAPVSGGDNVVANESLARQATAGTPQSMMPSTATTLPASPATWAGQIQSTPPVDDPAGNRFRPPGEGE